MLVDELEVRRKGGGEAAVSGEGRGGEAAVSGEGRGLVSVCPPLRTEYDFR